MYITNLPYGASEDEIRAHFETLGEVETVVVCKEPCGPSFCSWAGRRQSELPRFRLRHLRAARAYWAGRAQRAEVPGVRRARPVGARPQVLPGAALAPPGGEAEARGAGGRQGGAAGWSELPVQEKAGGTSSYKRAGLGSVQLLVK